jgi:hypothetical protein
MFGHKDDTKFDVIFKVKLCEPHKSYYVVNQAVTPHKEVVTQVTTGIAPIMAADKKGKPVLDKRGNAVSTGKYPPLLDKRGQPVFVGTEIADVKNKPKDDFVVADVLVMQNLRLISQCPYCKVVIEHE